MEQLRLYFIPVLVTVLWRSTITLQGIIPAMNNNGKPNDFPDNMYNLCPVVDCLPMRTFQQCHHKDTYITTMELYGTTCPGCPACRDYAYLKDLSQDISNKLRDAKVKVQKEQSILNKNEILLEQLRKLTRDSTSHTGTSSVRQMLEENLSELQKIQSASSLVKALRYMEENHKELNSLMTDGIFLEERLDVNVDGYFQNIIRHTVASYDDIPYYMQYRYDKILQDYILDMLSQLHQQTDQMAAVIAHLDTQIHNITAIDEEGYGQMNLSNPLMLRRLFQLLESNKGSLHVYLKTNMEGVDELNKYFKPGTGENADKLTKNDKSTSEDTSGNQNRKRRHSLLGNLIGN